VDAGLGAQQAEGVFALDLDRGALDARGFTRGLVFDRGLEALAFGVLEVLAQQHAGPVLRLGTACAGLDVDEAVVGVGRVVEHPAELELLDLLAQFLGVVGDGLQARLVAFFLAHLVELGVVGQVTLQALDGQHHAVQRLLFLAQFLGLLGVVPDRRVFQRGVDRPQAFGFGIEVKDTSASRPSGCSGRPGWCQ